MNELRNRVQLIGHLGADPETKSFENGRTKTSFSIATNENYKDKEGNWNTETTWHNVVAWTPLAERVSERLSKGKEVAILGKLINRSYEAKSGEKKYITEVQMSTFELFDKTKKEVAETKS